MLRRLHVILVLEEVIEDVHSPQDLLLALGLGLPPVVLNDLQLIEISQPLLVKLLQ